MRLWHEVLFSFVLGCRNVVVDVIFKCLDQFKIDFFRRIRPLTKPEMCRLPLGDTFTQNRRIDGLTL